MFKTAVFLACSLCATIVVAQDTSGGPRHITKSDQSPAMSTETSIGGHRVLIQYSAPSARGRKVEGGLIPYDNWWRLGANEATTLTTDADIMIGNLNVPKGTYTLYLIATSGSDWKLAVNKQTGQWGTQYDQGQDLGRVPMKVTKTSAPVEQLAIKLHSSGENAGSLTIDWGSSRATVPIKLAH